MSVGSMRDGTDEEAGGGLKAGVGGPPHKRPRLVACPAGGPAGDAGGALRGPAEQTGGTVDGQESMVAGTQAIVQVNCQEGKGDGVLEAGQGGGPDEPNSAAGLVQPACVGVQGLGGGLVEGGEKLLMGSVGGRGTQGGARQLQEGGWAGGGVRLPAGSLQDRGKRVAAEQLPSMEAFLQQYMGVGGAGRPVVVDGGMLGWPALERWPALEYLKQVPPPPLPLSLPLLLPLPPTLPYPLCFLAEVHTPGLLLCPSNHTWQRPTQPYGARTPLSCNRQ